MTDPASQPADNCAREIQNSVSASTGLLTRASLFANLNDARPQAREIAWEEFRARYFPVIAGFAKRCGASPQDVDDIIQDVMTGFIGTCETFVYDPAKGRFRGWLKTCTVRAAIRRAGKNLRFRGMQLADLPQVELAVEPEWNDVWEQQLVSQALTVLKCECGETLPFRAFEQYVLLDRDAKVVATELGTSVNNVHQAKSRMTARLRGLVEELRRLDD